MYHFITTIPCNYHIKNSISGRNSIVEVCTNYDVYSMPGGVAAKWALGMSCLHAPLGGMLPISVHTFTLSLVCVCVCVCVCVTHEKTIWWQSRPRAAI